MFSELPLLKLLEAEIQVHAEKLGFYFLQCELNPDSYKILLNFVTGQDKFFIAQAHWEHVARCQLRTCLDKRYLKLLISIRKVWLE